MRWKNSRCHYEVSIESCFGRYGREPEKTTRTANSVPTLDRNASSRYNIYDAMYIIQASVARHVIIVVSVSRELVLLSRLGDAHTFRCIFSSPVHRPVSVIASRRCGQQCKAYEQLFLCATPPLMHLLANLASPLFFRRIWTSSPRSASAHLSWSFARAHFATGTFFFFSFFF